MTTDNPSDSLSQLPPLSKEMKRTLRLRAWRDEIFREALIADPKGIIEDVFRQSLPNGKLPDDLTIKVIEEDPYTHHIVLPALSNQFATLEIPEEEQLGLLVNMGFEGKWSRDGDKSKSSDGSTNKRKRGLDEILFKQKEQFDQEEYTSKSAFKKIRVLHWCLD